MFLKRAFPFQKTSWWRRFGIGFIEIMLKFFIFEDIVISDIVASNFFMLLHMVQQLTNNRDIVVLA